MSTRQVGVHHGLIRPKLLIGGERQAVIYNFGFGFALLMLTRSVSGLIAAIVICGSVQGILTALARRDHQMIGVVHRSLKYQKFYDVAQTLDAEPSETHIQHQAPLEHLIFWAQSILKKKGT